MAPAPLWVVLKDMADLVCCGEVDISLSQVEVSVVGEGTHVTRHGFSCISTLLMDVEILLSATKLNFNHIPVNCLQKSLVQNRLRKLGASTRCPEQNKQDMSCHADLHE